MRLEIAELSLAALDAVRVDTVALFVGPERPLPGLAGLADWRLCGALSRALRGGTYGGASGEQLLVPAAGRLGAARVVCFGVPEPPRDEVAFRAVSYRVLDALLRAGSRAHAASLPPRAAALPHAAAARLWLEALVRFPPERAVVLGDAGLLRRDLTAARDSLLVDVEIAVSEGGPDPAASWPAAPAVVR